MAVVLYKQQGDTLYEVRQAGGSTRLYTNGVLHSQYNPQQVLTRSVWDLLFLPSLFVPEQQIQRVLVLGVGGGAVLQQLHRWVNPALMVGVELNAMHLQIARDYFGLSYPSMVLYHDDAVAWLQRYQGPPFDYIVDDLYGHQNGEPQRAVALDAAWCELLQHHLSATGVLVCNTVSWKELRGSALLDQVADDESSNSRYVIQQDFLSGIRLVTPTCDNAVGAFFKQRVKKNAFKKRLQSVPELLTADQNGQLRYQIRTLF